ncbi:unnamed protein product [Oikopleura dioica]|uniref:LITAF domain-containing protein n=1 Tax=Oikopleura dioica TaxID=34765 RepID=E4Y7W3_OIKDI|nr:unnamed protein product [Oikopleura dioica]
MVKTGVEENERKNEEKKDENDKEVNEILSPSGFANPPYPPSYGQAAQPGPTVDQYGAPVTASDVPAYAQPPPYSAPQSLAPSPQPVIINIQQNVSSHNIAPAAPVAPVALTSTVFGHESLFCKCPFCGYEGMTMMEKRGNNLAWCICCLCLMFGIPCCCVPCFFPSLQDTYHNCAMCNQQIGSHQA